MENLRIAAVIEAYTVTGPAKNLIRFAQLARTPDADLPTIDLHVVTYVREEGEAQNAFLSALESAGIAFHVVRERGAMDTAVIRQLRRAVDAIQPRIVQTHSVKSHFLARLSGISVRWPWLAFHHGYTNEKAKVRLYNQLDRWSLRTAQRVVTVCEPFRRELAERGVAPERISVIPNAVEPAPVRPDQEPRPFGLEGEAKVILHIGRFSVEKNHMGMLNAFAMLRRQHPEWNTHLVFVGDGVDRQRVEEEVASQALEGAVHFAGQQRDIWPYLRGATVFTLPSLSEGSPNVILEAMSAGLPIVASQVGGIPDMISHEQSGLLCPPGDEAALTGAWASLLQDPPKAEHLGRAALSRVEQFHPRLHRERLSSVYAGLIASN